MTNMPRSFIELNAQAFYFNILQIKNIIGNTQLACVVKSNAYGHGIKEIALLAQAHPDIALLCTAGLQEALLLRNLGIYKPILVLSYIDTDHMYAIINNIKCTVYKYHDAYQLHKAAQLIGKKAYVHIKIDSGMSRLGQTSSTILEFIARLQQLSGLVIEGIFTHLSDTANQDQSFSYEQLIIFNTLLDQLKKLGIYIPVTHALSSSGLYLQSKKAYSLIRAGTILYGLIKSDIHQKLLQQVYPEFITKPILTWKTHIIDIKHIPQNASIGYNRTYITDKPATIAFLPVGYSDGYRRNLSNKAFVKIRNYFAPVIGIISMNLTTIDVSNIPDVSLYDSVELVGNCPELNPFTCAQQADIITNEFITGIHPNIERVIVHASQPLEYSTYKSQKNMLNSL